MRPHHQGRLAAVVPGRTERAEDIADPVDAHLQSKFAHPLDQPIAAGLFRIGQGDPRTASIGRVEAYLVEGADLLKEDRAIQAQIGRKGAHRFLRNRGRDDPTHPRRSACM
ncbi:hypothetical protein D3C78_1583300 [compost metagenome]